MMSIICILLIGFLICSVLAHGETISTLEFGDGIHRQHDYPSDGYVDSLTYLQFTCQCSSSSAVAGLQLPDGSVRISSNVTTRIDDKFPLGGSFGCLCDGVLDQTSLKSARYRLCNINEYLMANRLCSEVIPNFFCAIHVYTDMKQLRSLSATAAESTTSTTQFCKTINFDINKDCSTFKHVPGSSLLCLNSISLNVTSLCRVPHYEAQNAPIILRDDTNACNSGDIEFEVFIVDDDSRTKIHYGHRLLVSAESALLVVSTRHRRIKAYLSVVKMAIATNDSKFSIHNGQPKLIFQSIGKSTSLPRFAQGFVFITFGRKDSVTEIAVRYGANCGQARSILCKIGDYDDQIAKVGKIVWTKDNAMVKMSADAKSSELETNQIGKFTCVVQLQLYLGYPPFLETKNYTKSIIVEQRCLLQQIEEADNFSYHLLLGIGIVVIAVLLIFTVGVCYERRFRAFYSRSVYKDTSITITPTSSQRFSLQKKARTKTK